MTINKSNKENDSKRRILLVDDEADIREVFKEEFLSIGWEVYEASNGLEAIELFNKTPMDVILSDVRMPKSTGIDLLTKIRAIHPTVPMVFLVSGFTDLTAEQAKKSGANRLFNKPFNLSEIMDIIVKESTGLASQV